MQILSTHTNADNVYVQKTPDGPSNQDRAWSVRSGEYSGFVLVDGSGGCEDTPYPFLDSFYFALHGLEYSSSTFLNEASSRAFFSLRSQGLSNSYGVLTSAFWITDTYGYPIEVNLHHIPDSVIMGV